jgi:hypothetical protein
MRVGWGAAKYGNHADYDLRCEKLTRDARRNSDTAPRNAAAATPNSAVLQAAKLLSVLEACPTARSRATVALSLLLEHSRSGSGYLFAIGCRGPSASHARTPPSPRPRSSPAYVPMSRKRSARDRHDAP